MTDKVMIEASRGDRGENDMKIQRREKKSDYFF